MIEGEAFFRDGLDLDIIEGSFDEAVMIKQCEKATVFHTLYTFAWKILHRGYEYSAEDEIN